MEETSFKHKNWGRTVHWFTIQKHFI